MEVRVTNIYLVAIAKLKVLFGKLLLDKKYPLVMKDSAEHFRTTTKLICVLNQQRHVENVISLFVSLPSTIVKV